MDASFLSEIQILKNLNDNERNIVLERTKKEIFKKNETIFREGDHGDSLYIIIEGTVRISTFIAGIGEETLAILSDGEIFGEMPLIDNNLRSAHAIAHKDSILLVMTRESFLYIIDNYKNIGIKILQELINNFCLRFKNTCENLKNFYLMDKFC
ncbi:MAG: cyclic nucleotide-binding domain-containing protein [Candidatus Firestonebacteria bacterium]|nr:cyclic nucleotide-binding domain-containing protein [Candidatus Firestonebacteria bacterium]